MKSQQRKYMVIEGRNPLGPVAIGRASIPTPMVVAEMRRVPPKTCPRDRNKCIGSPHIKNTQKLDCVISIFFRQENINIFLSNNFYAH
jgi:hypothetical protein